MEIQQFAIATYVIKGYNFNLFALFDPFGNNSRQSFGIWNLSMNSRSKISNPHQFNVKFCFRLSTVRLNIALKVPKHLPNIVSENLNDRRCLHAGNSYVIYDSVLILSVFTTWHQNLICASACSARRSSFSNPHTWRVFMKLFSFCFWIIFHENQISNSILCSVYLKDSQAKIWHLPIWQLSSTHSICVKNKLSWHPQFLLESEFPLRSRTILFHNHYKSSTVCKLLFGCFD